MFLQNWYTKSEKNNITICSDVPGAYFSLIHPFDNYVILPGSLALVNREPITLRNLLMRARLQDQKVCVT
jgi:hypothetical protein